MCSTAALRAGPTGCRTERDRSLETVGKDHHTASILNDPRTGQPLLLRSSSGRQALYVYDATPGSPIALLSATPDEAFAYAYDPYGVPTITEDSDTTAINENPYLFAGGIQDRTTGWIHYGARYYDPTTGSFTQQDSLDAPLDPLNGNRYAYAGNDPVNITDPTGYDADYSCNIAAGGLAFSLLGLGAAAIAPAPPVGAALISGGSVILAGGLIYSTLGVADSCYEDGENIYY